MEHQFIDAEDTDGVLVVTMDDPPTRNAIGEAMAREIGVELDRLESDPSLRALVITGRDPSFCSGANVRQMDQSNREQGDEASVPADLSPWTTLEQRWSERSDGADGIDGTRAVALRLHRLQKPSIAAVNGYAMGLGMGIALSCDIRIASDRARFSETFIRRGLIPADGSCWQLPRMIGLGATLMLQYTGDVLEADEALRLGIANKVVEHDVLMEEALGLAKRLARGPTYAMALIKRLVLESLDVDFEESLHLAGAAQGIARQTADHREGVRAFLEKREPAFKGR